ncbi:hypothetical protein IJU97_01425 [bacterium]|nr:hypothetical protein [bacterium]
MIFHARRYSNTIFKNAERSSKLSQSSEYACLGCLIVVPHVVISSIGSSQAAPCSCSSSIGSSYGVVGKNAFSQVAISAISGVHVFSSFNLFSSLIFAFSSFSCAEMLLISSSVGGNK